MPSKVLRHSAWVHARYVAWLESGAPDVWQWLVGKAHAHYEYPLSARERTRIINVRRSLIDAVSEPDLHL